MTMSQTRQHNGIIPWCAKAHCDVQNVVRTAEKNATNLFPVCQDDEDISKIHQANGDLRKYQSHE